MDSCSSDGRAFPVDYLTLGIFATATVISVTSGDLGCNGRAAAEGASARGPVAGIRGGGRVLLDYVLVMVGAIRYVVFIVPDAEALLAYEQIAGLAIR